MGPAPLSGIPWVGVNPQHLKATPPLTLCCIPHPGQWEGAGASSS